MRSTQARRAYFEAPAHDTGLALTRCQQLQNDLWGLTQAAFAAAPTPITALFVQSLNDTFDVSEMQIATLENRIPESVWLMISVISALAAFA